MNFKPAEERRWKMQRNQSTGSLMLALNTKVHKFQKASARVAKSRGKLHATKMQLQKIIKEYKKAEREVKQKKVQHKNTVEQLEAVIEEMHTPGYDISQNEELALWYYSKSVVCNAKAEANDIEFELDETKVIDSSADNPNYESPNNTVPMPCSVTISNIDISGAIQRNGVAKLDNTKKCCICMKNEINAIFYNCKHECCCIDCAKNLAKNGGKCPICQCSSKRVIKTFAT